MMVRTCSIRGLRALIGLSLLIAWMSTSAASAEELAPRPRAPALNGKAWFNSQPLTLEQLRGKIVLVDFWEYTCINCIRTFPYLRRWNDLYAPDGLVVIGVHTPEFAFAKDSTNVANAVKRFNFTFPVVVDSDYSIWNAFHNEAWPADYLIDKDGHIAYVHFGEGEYGTFEHEIRKLLKEANPKLEFSSARYTIPADADADTTGNVCRRATPETYLGAERANNLANPGGEDTSQEVNYATPAQVPLDYFALTGDWLAAPEYVRHNRPDHSLMDAVELHYQAKSVYLVAGSDDGHVKPLYLLQDGKPLARQSWGIDVKMDDSGRPYIPLSGKRMYYLVNNADFGEHMLILYATAAATSLYSFTFGNNCEGRFVHQ